MRYILCILCFSLSLPLMSQQREVGDIFSEIASHPLVLAEFSQKKTILRLEKSFHSSGRVIFDASRGIAWLNTAPFPSKTLLTDEGMTQISSSGEKRSIRAEGNETFIRFAGTIQSVFLGDMDFITREYLLDLQENSNGVWTIVLTPKDQSLLQIVKEFEISGRDFIESFLIMEAGGDSIEYRFMQIEYPQSLNTEDQRVFQ